MRLTGSARSTRARAAILAVALTASVAVAVTPTAGAAADDLPGTRPGSTSRLAAAAADDAPTGLEMVVNERGLISRSIVGSASSYSDPQPINVHKPAGAVVRGAYLAYATLGFSGSPLSEPLMLSGQPVPLTNEVASGISSYNYFADVTDIVKPIVDPADSGDVELTITEPEYWLTDGEILVVIYDDPGVTATQSVTLMYGALAPTGDVYDVRLAAPVDYSDDQTKLEMSLGISFSYQTNGTQQFSTVDVNGGRLTSAAGGEDDGYASNGGLITVGGDGDSADNPEDPFASPSYPRSDDELYDLSPYVADGSDRIEVTTDNPSLDDNVFLATFTMNPPVQRIITDDDPFVYVAFGDSFQSGEGAGSAYPDATDYYINAYENGDNYPQRVGPQEDTLTDFASGGNDCHRALQNYAKTNRDRLSPGSAVVLIDVTCSGAKIEPGGQPPILGYRGASGIAGDSQAQQAIDQLASAGYGPEDVDLITMGMGGNDAKFSDLVAACLIPNLTRRLVEAYPDTPSEISLLVNQFLSCQGLDKLVFKTDDAIDTLAETERWAQTTLLGLFPNSEFLQLNYPGILPDADDAPSWCGGIREEDIDYADEKAAKINDIIRDSVSAAQVEANAQDRRFDLVDVTDAFGSNALCPASSSDQLANGISEENFTAELRRLLNLDGDGDAYMRGLLDNLVENYNFYWSCASVQWLPWSSCDIDDAADSVAGSVAALKEYLGNHEKEVLANLAKPPSTGESTLARYDRSRGLFHPNYRGIQILACHVEGTYRYLGTYDCGSVDGAPQRRSAARSAMAAATMPLAPVDVPGSGASLDVTASGFGPGATVELSLSGPTRSLGHAVADDAGVVQTTVTLPAAVPGVHTVTIEGTTESGMGVGQKMLVRYPGRPDAGDPYGVYLCCFEQRPADLGKGYLPEDIEVSYLGKPLYQTRADRDGGLLVVVPAADLGTRTGPVAIEARSLKTGKVVRHEFDPVPSVTSLWATGAGGTGVTVSGTGFLAAGRVHSDGRLAVSGSRSTMTGGVEYGTTLSVSGTGHVLTPAPHKVAAGGSPHRVPLSAYRPGGAAAKAAGSTYRAVPASACVKGVWTPKAAELTGVLYVPCSVSVSATGATRTVTLAAEGTIAVGGSRMVLQPPTVGAPTLVSGSSSSTAVTVAGSSVTLAGPVFAANGTVLLQGSGATVSCGVVAAAISVSGSNVSVPVTREKCSPT